jgi:aromatic-L-amino-acid/L-tryptophan decarboxylase
VREFREWGHRLIDWVADYLEAPEPYPVLSSVRPNEILNALPSSGPETGEPMDRIFADFERLILPGITHWNHPEFLAYFANTSSPPAILGELLAAALNANGILWQTSPAVTELEMAVLRWLLDWFDLPRHWFGMILDTASTSTLHALAAARVFASPETRDEGAPRNLVVYCSDQAHSSVEKGAMALGFGRDHVRRIPSDAAFRMRADSLAEAVSRDRERGMLPCCVVATVGTTSTTSIDPVPEIAEVARRHNIWLHVDAAYAGPAALVPELKWILEGAEQADSLVFNPHKWLMVPVDCSVLYCARPDALQRAFSLVPEYLRTADEGVNLMDYAIPLGRRFRSLKLWFVLRYYGRQGLADLIRDQVNMIAELRERIAQDPRFEIAAPSPLSVVCFRLKGGDAANRRLLETVNSSGHFFISHTVLNGRYVLRIAVGNAGTNRQTLDRLWKLIAQLASSEVL